MRTIHLATGNAHKAAEFQALADASGPGLRILAADRMPAVVEDTGTFLGNARKKAAALRGVIGPENWVLADDSGLCVDALEGAPGVESAYYAGPAGDSAANLQKLVRAMAAVPDDRRAAYFICVLVLLGPGGRELRSEGRCEGRLQRTPAGGHGFGYDPLFVPVGHERSFAELPPPTKHRLSHRGRAWAKLVAQLGQLTE